MSPEQFLSHNSERPKPDIIAQVRAIEVPLLTALYAEYGNDTLWDGSKRGWDICGPASIALSRILSHRLGIPIQREGGGERLELRLSIYDPKNDPQRTGRIVDQTNILYHDGTGNVCLIDPIYNLGWGRTKDIKGAIITDWATEETIDALLVNKYSLYAHTQNLEAVSFLRWYSQDTPPTAKEFDDSISSFNDVRATMDRFVNNSGEIVEPRIWGQRVKSVIKTIEPSWEIDKGAQRREEERLAEKLAEGLQIFP